ncbi:MAG: S-ribosylhomocysteine lyase [Clostridia bacterium]|nr:S-ribosylhomocysteine lyase [Clostridia bacterium]
MDRIPSFSKDHDKLATGLHECNTVSGVTTWDLRFKKPNAGDYISPAALHTIEHLLATILRNSDKKQNIIYFGPMGCRTGFYLLTVNMGYDEVLKLLKESFVLALGFTEVPGNKREECGNYLEHDLDGAKEECKKYSEILQNL